MIKEPRPRHLSWDGCVNVRDLGGHPTADGRETRWGAVIRSDDPARLSAAGRAALVDYGVRSVVDLRRSDELEKSPSPFARPGAHGITYTNISFLDPAVPSPETEFTTLAEDYCDMLDRYHRAVAAVIRAIASAPEGGVVIHCAAGKDRAGLISALVLGTARVPHQTIAEDYALSAEYRREVDADWLENGPGDRAERARILEKFRPRVPVMLEVLGHLDQRYGGVEGYLRAAGVTTEEIARLRERIVPTT